MIVLGEQELVLERMNWQKKLETDQVIGFSEVVRGFVRLTVIERSFGGKNKFLCSGCF